MDTSTDNEDRRRGFVLYGQGVMARINELSFDANQPRPWQLGWQDLQEQLEGMAEHDAGKPFDASRSQAWRGGWNAAAGGPSSWIFQS